MVLIIVLLTLRSDDNLAGVGILLTNVFCWKHNPALF